MSKLSADDRTLLQNIQEGLSGVKPIDDNFISMVIDALKNKPNLFKTLFKGRGAMFGKYALEFALRLVLIQSRWSQ